MIAPYASDLLVILNIAMYQCPIDKEQQPTTLYNG